jgi:hypothetical protein
MIEQKNPTRLENGDIRFPVSSIPPARIKGSIRDEVDHHLFRSETGECLYREVIAQKRTCCGFQERFYCKLHGRRVLPNNCSICKDKKAK